MPERLRCECCEEPAFRRDVDGVPLCEECWNDLAIETAAIAEAGK